MWVARGGAPLWGSGPEHVQKKPACLPHPPPSVFPKLPPCTWVGSVHACAHNDAGSATHTGGTRKKGTPAHGGAIEVACFSVGMVFGSTARAARDSRPHRRMGGSTPSPRPSRTAPSTAVLVLMTKLLLRSMIAAKEEGKRAVEAEKDRFGTLPGGPLLRLRCVPVSVSACE